MTLKAILFVSGVLAWHLCDFLPAVSSLFAAAAAVALLFSPRLRPLVVCLLGFAWAAWQGLSLLEPAVPNQVRGETVLIEGTIEDRPEPRRGGRIRFLFKATRLDDGSGWRAFDHRVRLNWYGKHAHPAAGERWQLAVRLKEPGGFANPGGFDYELWLFRQRIRATGYVRNDSRNQRLGYVPVAAVTALRHRLAAAMEGPVGLHPSMALVQALTIGQRHHISSEQWQVLRATGTGHLMAISGLHISLVAGLVFGGVRFTWSRVARLAGFVPAPRAAALAALLASLLYALLSGFAIPAQRALIMVSVLMLAVMSGRRTSFAGIISVAAIVTLLLDPLSVLSVGWWLSFWAVAVIAWFSVGRLGRPANIRRWIAMPAMLAFCMAPLLLLFFQQVSLTAPLANIVAVPWVSFLVVPPALAGTLLFLASEPAGLLLMKVAAGLLDWLWQGLEWLAGLEFTLLGWPQPPAWVLLFAVGGVALLCVPRGVPGRWSGVLLLLPLVFVSRPQPAAGEAWITLLDVGQGLSAVIRTATHTLVYDTGPAFGPDFDTGRAVVAPYLRYQGVRNVDRLMISHGDNDHMGGARSLLEDYPVTDVLTSVPAAFPGRRSMACWRGRQWSWDGVRFAVLHPAQGDDYQGNDASCVLRIEVAGGQSLLLPGDIELAGEQALLQRYGNRLASTVLVVPHHGSRTSSSAAFVRAVGPAIALVPAGYMNRYRFPRPEVVARYRAAGSRLLETGRTGAISVKLSPRTGIPQIDRFRDSQPRYWRRRE